MGSRRPTWAITILRYFSCMGFLAILCMLYIRPPAHQRLDLSEERSGATVATPRLISPSVVSGVLPDTGAQKIGEKIDTVLLIEKVQLFESTIKSCLGDYCFDDDTSDGLRTVGFLSPSASIDGLQLIVDMVEKIAPQKKMALQVGSHVPAYGYGKNHGFSKIVRFVGNIPATAHAILTSVRAIGDGVEDMELLSLQVKQLVRWHCRLNHVAAHTSMLSIFVDDFVRNPVVELSKIITFISRKDPLKFDELKKIVEKRRAQFTKKMLPLSSYCMFYDSTGNNQIEMNEINGHLYPRHWGSVPKLQTRDFRPFPGGFGAGSGTMAHWIQKNMDKDASDVLNNYRSRFDPSNYVANMRESTSLVLAVTTALNDEIDAMQKWPCRTFHELEKLSSNKLPIAAAKLAADCTNEAVKCGVPVDKRGG